MVLISWSIRAAACRRPAPAAAGRRAVCAWCSCPSRPLLPPRPWPYSSRAVAAPAAHFSTAAAFRRRRLRLVAARRALPRCCCCRRRPRPPVRPPAWPTAAAGLARRALPPHARAAPSGRRRGAERRAPRSSCDGVEHERCHLVDVRIWRRTMDGTAGGGRRRSAGAWAAQARGRRRAPRHLSSCSSSRSYPPRAAHPHRARTHYLPFHRPAHPPAPTHPAAAMSP